MCVPLRTHLTALRVADEKFAAERDRRYSEVADERAKALQIKDEADKTALSLARQINDLHLTNLNGEQARLLADRERYLSREVFDQEQKTFSSWRDVVNGALALGTGKGLGSREVVAYLLAAAAIGFSLWQAVAR
jgi:hypothetical protein